MQVIRTMAELTAKIAECNDALTHKSDSAMRALFDTFVFDFSSQAPADPFSPEYARFQMSLHAAITGRDYTVQSERTLFLVDNYEHRPFPYYLQSPITAGYHYGAISLLLRSMNLRPGARVLEFGPGWGNTTLVLAMLGMCVTAVDVEPNYCEIIRRRAAAAKVEIDVVQADFFWVEKVDEPFDAVVFFECFHHCADHMRLLHGLCRAVKPEGRVYFASEPILPGYPIPWGIRTDGEALWAMRNFGWLELGFRESYFNAALARTGWRAEALKSNDLDWANVHVAHRAPADPAAVEQMDAVPPPPPPIPYPSVPPPDFARQRLADELEAVYRSTSWRLTAPIRALRRRFR